MSVYINKVKVYNTALPAAAANLLAADIAPGYDPGMLRVYVCFSIDGIFSIYRTNIDTATSEEEQLNGGIALVAGASYLFYIPWTAYDTINLRLSTTGGTINIIQVDEGDD